MTEVARLRVLLVEDEGPIALMIEDMLADLGCDVVASAAHFGRACELAISAQVDIAVLDLNLDGQSAVPVAHILSERGIPFVFSTGYGADRLPQEFAACPSVTKPFSFADLQEKIRVARQRA